MRQVLKWETKSFRELTPGELYKILQLRQEVFILEQSCVYSDLDNKDQKSHHLMAWDGTILSAYTRLIPFGVSYPDALSIGRVVIPKDYRGAGLGEKLMRRSIAAVTDLYGSHPIKISAQQHLKVFYNRLGFLQTSEPYLDAGIMHIEMTLA